MSSRGSGFTDPDDSWYQDHKRQEQAIALQAKLLADSSTSPLGTPLKEHPNYLTPPSGTAALPPSANPALGLADTASFLHDRPQISFNPSEKFRERSSTSTGRHRSGSASGGGGGDGKTKEVLNDIAHQSKKGFNAIMQKLSGDKDRADKEEGGYVMVGSSSGDGEGSGLQRRGTGRGDPTRGMGTMRGVKLKRDADDAGKSWTWKLLMGR
jgi:hypothetical protein